MNATMTETIKLLMADCEAQAKSRRWVPYAGPTAKDIEWVAAQVELFSFRRPTAEEWAAAGV